MLPEWKAIWEWKIILESESPSVQIFGWTPNSVDQRKDELEEKVLLDERPTIKFWSFKSLLDVVHNFKFPIFNKKFFFEMDASKVEHKAMLIIPRGMTELVTYFW